MTGMYVWAGFNVLEYANSNFRTLLCSMTIRLILQSELGIVSFALLCYQLGYSCLNTVAIPASVASRAKVGQGWYFW